MYPKNTHITQLHGDNTATVVSKSSFFTDFLGLLAAFSNNSNLFVAEKNESEPNLSSFFNKTLGNFARVSFIDDLLLVADSPTTH